MNYFYFWSEIESSHQVLSIDILKSYQLPIYMYVWQCTWSVFYALHPPVEGGAPPTCTRDRDRQTKLRLIITCIIIFMEGQTLYYYHTYCFTNTQTFGRDTRANQILFMLLLDVTANHILFLDCGEYQYNRTQELINKKPTNLFFSKYFRCDIHQYGTIVLWKSEVD
jgi:hypothetical protein